MTGSLRELVAVMDRLRSPGGCPWDARQTHASLLPYLLEEAYETIEAVEAGDAVALREELGDLLLQVVFHARIALSSSGAILCRTLSAVRMLSSLGSSYWKPCRLASVRRSSPRIGGIIRSTTRRSSKSMK